MIGASVGPYRIEDEIGSGTIGMNFRAEDTRTRRRVLLKVLRPELGSNEAYWADLHKNLARLKAMRHRHLVPLLDLVEDAGRRIIVQEFVRGHSLLQELDERGGALPLARFYVIFRQVLAAIGHAHGLGILHLALRPNKIMISRTGEEDRIKLLDVGLGPVHNTGSSLPHHNPMELEVDCAYYLAPEQFHKGMDVSHKSDIYSVGVLMYEAATGYVPFGGEDIYDVIRGHLMDRPQAPASLEPSVPWHLSATILRALSKHPADRFEDARDFGYHLIACQRGAVLEAKPRAVKVKRKSPPPETVPERADEDTRKTVPIPEPPLEAQGESEVSSPDVDAMDDPEDATATMVSSIPDIASVEPEARPEDEDDSPEEADEDTDPSILAARLVEDERSTTLKERATLPVAPLPEVPKVARLKGFDTPGPTLPRGLPPRDLKPLPEGVPNPSYLGLLEVDEPRPDEPEPHADPTGDDSAPVVSRIGLSRLAGYKAPSSS